MRDLRGVARELLAEPDRGRIHEVGAPGLEHVVELGRLALEGPLQVCERRQQIAVDQDRSGLPSEAEYVAAYCRRTGRAGIANWNFYLAFSMFRLASILQGVYARGLQGNAASAFALQRGAAAKLIADKAWEIARRPTRLV